MGLSTMAITQSTESMMTRSHYHTHKAFLLCNYLLLGAASSCIFLTLSLRLIPSACGLLLILLHILTIFGAIYGAHSIAQSAPTARRHDVHMVSTVLAAIFQGAVSVLIFTRTDDFLYELRSYVQQVDAAVILRMAGGLCIAIFCLEWIVLALAFALKYYAYVEGDSVGSSTARRSAKVQCDQEMKDYPWPFQV